MVFIIFYNNGNGLGISWRYWEISSSSLEVEAKPPPLSALPSVIIGASTSQDFEEIFQYLLDMHRPLYRGAQWHFSVKDILSVGITWKIFSKALKYFNVYLNTMVFAVIETCSSKLLLESQIQTCFDVLLTQKYQNVHFECILVRCIISSFSHQ